MGGVGSEISALVLGAGNFGRHYARILSQLNAKDVPGIPRINKLIVTRTRQESALGLAADIRSSSDCSVSEVIGEKVRNREDAVDLMEKHRPQFIGIAARDRVIGDTIHAAYTSAALNYGIVLCEKPFSNATGDGSSLGYFDDLAGRERAEYFGLELPLAVLMRDLQRNQYFRDLFKNPANLEFHWERGGVYG